MQRNVLDYLEHTVAQFPDKIAFSNGENSLTFSALQKSAQAIGSFLHKELGKKPVAVFMQRHPHMIAAFLGVLYSGGLYVPLDEEMSPNRISLILQAVAPGAIICDSKTIAAMKNYDFPGQIYLYDELCATIIDVDALALARAKALDTDPVYIVYTSGSTGMPKGVLANHRNVIDYADALSPVANAGSTSVFGMQAPLYVDAFLKDIFLTLKHGATTYVIPKSMFMFPLRLLEYLNRHNINTLCWVVSALTMISSVGALEKQPPQFVHTIVFGGEIFPLNQFALWRKALPKARFINMYGPTECTGFSCYHVVDREDSCTEPIPIGRPFPNTEVLLINNGELVTSPDEAGEIYIRGAGVAPGYYNDEARTQEAFVQNPLHNAYPETLYRTGDLAKYNTNGELLYLSRKDFQIKHMGYRIELMEIEAAATRLQGIQTACCVFDTEKSKIVLFYVGEPTDAEVITYMRKMLPRYMVPAIARMLPALPLTQNSKIDRTLLANRAKEL